MGCGVAPQTRMPVHTLGLKRYFWIPKMVVFETHLATTLGSGVVLGNFGFWGGAPSTHIFAHHGPEKVVSGYLKW